ncbi:hypothetical protein A2856_03885 [Candidatus Uhrbacteria bacterium RIFCSPHIGHO2_01_FULL_63_20]|uniref:NYN domain-containing protein n=1 Tax=Candidatus Uhrbacteria bacterium RIFCSPHIGHO2_01_FULL_63_20 TaxID=1802385 RepID=A0A1F7TNQ4_9BACT|nr:MAG: hypothetical protein A2856_03885 [Candidatus Uhrbacteria bacterium RIFCSPHIGHO2_01_FULL_63_20]
MRRIQKNFAFIDSQNLNLAIRAQGWFLSFRKFRIYLSEKYGVEKAYVFIGYLVGNAKLYQALQEAGFICVFKPTLTYKDGTHKGNCDAELVLQAMIDFDDYERAVIVSGDGDFYCLVKYLIEQKKLEALLIPHKQKYSALLKFKEIRPYLRFMNDLREKLGYKKEKTPQGRNLEG